MELLIIVATRCATCEDTNVQKDPMSAPNTGRLSLNTDAALPPDTTPHYGAFCVFVRCPDEPEMPYGGTVVEVNQSMLERGLCAPDTVPAESEIFDMPRTNDVTLYTVNGPGDKEQLKHRIDPESIARVTVSDVSEEGDAPQVYKGRLRDLHLMDRSGGHRYAVEIQHPRKGNWVGLPLRPGKSVTVITVVYRFVSPRFV